MSFEDTTGRVYRNSAEWWTAVEKRAEILYGPKRNRWPHQDHSTDARSGEAPTSRGAVGSSPVRAPVHPVGAPFPSAREAPAASVPFRSPRKGMR